MMTAPNRAPFPYPGGKARIAARVWEELGNPYSYLEPFFGSGAVLLARTGGGREIVGDINGYVANAYRSIAYAPEETAHYAYWPTIHADLTARHRWLVRWGRDGGLQKLMDDPFYYDAQCAGWWLWGIASWLTIGDFCAAAFKPQAHCQVAVPDVPPKISYKRSGVGVSAARKGFGALPFDGRVCVGSASDSNRWVEWFTALSERLAQVFILNCAWDKVLGSKTLLGDFDDRDVGVFLDPPYLTGGRAANLYALDNGDEVFPAVWEWAKRYGERANFRIAICGLAGDFGNVPPGWREYRWRNSGGITNTTRSSRVKPDEVVLFSPHCIGGRRQNHPQPIFADSLVRCDAGAQQLALLE